MNIYLKALVVAIVIAILPFVAYMKWGHLIGVETPKGQYTRLDKFEKESVPDFELKTFNGSRFKLDQKKGKFILLNFWATWCAPCVEEFPSMVNLVHRFEGKIQLVTVSADERKNDATEFLKVFGGKSPHITHLYDPARVVAESYGTKKLPETYIIGKDFKLLRKVVNSINWESEDAIQFFEGL